MKSQHYDSKVKMKRLYTLNFFEQCLILLQRTLQGLESWSMFPHILLDVKPQFRVLDMCAAPGYIASQVAEAMNSEPLQSQSKSIVLIDIIYI
jgi:hypothetical protein